MVSKIGGDSVKAALAKAKLEVAEEEQKKMVQAFKSKIKEVETSRRILKNLERELEEMEFELGEL